MLVLFVYLYDRYLCWFFSKTKKPKKPKTKNKQKTQINPEIQIIMFWK